MSGRPVTVLCVVCASVFAVSVAAQEGGGGAAATATDGVETDGFRATRRRAVPTLPVVRDRVLIYALPRRDNPYGLGRAMLPEGRLGTRDWAGMQRGEAVYDPANGYFYSPGVFAGALPVTVKLGDGSVATVYMPFDPSRPLSEVQYAQLLAAARAFAEQEAAREAAGEEAAAAPAEEAEGPERPRGPRAAEQGRRFGSRLAPMLAGEERVSMEFAVGESLLRRGRFGEAISHLHRSSAAAPGDPASHLALALAFTGVGSYDLAAEAAKRGLRVAPDPAVLDLDPAAGLSGSEALAQLRSSVADALAESPDDPDLLVVAGYLAFLAGDYAEAAERLERSRETGLRDAGVARLLVASRAAVRAAEAEAARAEAETPAEGAEEAGPEAGD